MKFPPLNAGEIVRLDWVDSKSALGWAYNPNAKRKPGTIHSIGYIVESNDDCITITTSIGERGESIDDLSIPLGCLTDIEVLHGDFSF